MRRRSAAILLLPLPTWTSGLALKANSWQSRLDKALLDPDMSGEARFRSFQRAVQDPNLRKDVAAGIRAVREKGFGKGHPELIDELWPKGTIARADIEGLQSLTKQLPERLAEDTPLLSLVETLSENTKVKDPSSLVKAAVEDPAQAWNLGLNILRRNPDKVETVKYSVVEKLVGENVTVEVRDYPSIQYLSCSLDSSSAFTLNTMAEGLLKLSSALVGGNNKKGIARFPVTAPFTIVRTFGTSTMILPLPRAAEAEPPEPLDPSIVLMAVDEQRLAVAEFGGICTAGEVERQTEKLTSGLSASAYSISGAVQVSQYNPPGTLPWRRRNEISVPVRLRAAAAAAADEAMDRGGVEEETVAEVGDTTVVEEAEASNKTGGRVAASEDVTGKMSD